TNGEWHSARNNDTNVNFVEGAVYVREKERRGNYRKVADITRQPLGNSDINGDEDGNGGIRYHVAEGWIQSPNKEGLGNLQYRIANGPWRDLESVAGAKTYGVDFQPGKLEFRLGATATELPSLAIPYHKAIQAAAAPPQLAYDDLHYRIEGLNETTGEEENAVAIYEYRVNDGPWQLGTVVPDFSGDDVVRLRRRATADTLASQQQIINFTPNLNLYTVGLDVANGRLTGTTTAMEYSLDSNNGTSGTWQQANNTNTPVDFVEEQKVYVREGAKPRNFLKLSGGISKLNRPTTNNITYNIMEGRITIPKAYNNQLQYRIGSGDWANLPYGEIVEGDAIVGGIPFTSGKLMVRFRATTDKLPSDGNEVAEIKAPRSAPALTYDDVDYKIFGLYTKDNANEVLYQYKINNGPWRDGTIEGSFQGSDRVLIRLKATENKLPGEVQEIVFTPNIDFSHVGVDLANSRITGTTTDMEYSLDSTGGKGGTWLPCNNNATDVGFVSGGEVYLRQRNKPLHFYKVTQTERQEALVQDDLDAIDFHIQEGWLEIPEVLVGKLQYRIDLEDQIGDWIDIVATQQVEGNKMRMTGITFREGKLSFRRRATETLMASPAATADNFVIKAAESRPIVKEDPIKNTFSIKVNDEFVAVGSNDNGLEYYVYRINEGPWIPATIENDFSGTMKVEVRKKATKEALPSQEATIHFERTLDLSHVGLSTHITPYELNGTTETMEFTLVHNDGKLLWNPNHASYEEEGVPYTHYTYVDSDGTKHAPKGYKWGSHWKSCEEGNTPLIQHNGDNINYENFSHVLVRDRNQPENYIVIPLPEN
ncbi:MAG: hypothetical protein JJT76_15465, partial [Clostridiaceae bacterium]|nr:hypothetical protein [Clostridiaceae bacterium]